jgi:hypothetical protein
VLAMAAGCGASARSAPTLSASKKSAGRLGGDMAHVECVNVNTTDATTGAQVQIAWKGVGEYVDALTRALPWVGVWHSVGRR